MSEFTSAGVVDVHAIEEELAQVRWKQRREGEGDAAEHAAAEARANVLNLIAVVESERDVDQVSRVLDGLAVHHPSRTLMLLAQPDRSALKLEAKVTTQTQQDGPRVINSERVFLHAHGRVARHLASLVTPLLIPDLPVMLWWPRRPDFETELFRELADLCDRLVVDTDDGFETADLFRLLDVARRRHARCAVGDFTWARLMPWRHLTAQFFDVAAHRERLAHIRGVSVVSGEGRPMQCRLLAGWIRSRMRKVGLEVPWDLRQDPALESGISQFMIYTAGPDQPARFSIIRQRGNRLSTEVRIGDQEQVGRTVRVQPRKAEDLLAIELTLPGHDILYEEALAAAAED
ncbi:MAG TPA: glucose-6-phosphate dehydrogenase assembly protein OpcA [Candidatus Limnocylindrales bacterium]|nr:glucose-6-phosphate dehydrogenase assembly protein OpcA [Candidatus Limnocylindrales bacterium]